MRREGLLLCCILGLGAPAAATAATFNVTVSSPIDLGSVAAAPNGDTVFRVNPSTGVVTVVSGAGYRVAGGQARALVTVTCTPSRGPDSRCNEPIPFRIAAFGSVSGRARAFTAFTVAMGTATLDTPPSGTNPLAFTIAPVGANGSRTFYVGGDFPVAGDDSGLPTGPGDNNFSVNVVDAAGLPIAGDADKGRVTAFRALTVAKTADLSFGRIGLPSSGVGTVSLEAGVGQRSVSSSLVAYPTPAPTIAAFSVTGEGGQAFSASIPATFNLTGPGTITVTTSNTLPPAPTLSGATGQAGSRSFLVGGSFTVSPTTPTGLYSGVLTVTVDYN